MVGDNLWTVRFVKYIPHDKPGRYCLGASDPEEQTIYILMGQKPRERLSTFVHELIHVLEYEYNISIPHRLVYSLEDPIVRFLVDNYLLSA